MKIKKLIFGVTSFLITTVLGFGLVTSLHTQKTHLKAEALAAETVDYSRFKLRCVDTNVPGVLVNNADSLDYTGVWDSSFAVSDQFDTLAKSYSLKATIRNASWTNGNNDWFGFAVYYDNTTYIKFSLKWNNDCANSIAEAVIHNHVGGGWSGVDAISIDGAAWTNRDEWTDLWSDGMWYDSTGLTKVNLRTSSRILLSDGFDITLNVERKEHLGRLADVMRFKIDALAIDGVTPATYYSPTVALDSATNPKGAGESVYVGIKPQIGFFGNGVGTVHVSDVEFTVNAAQNYTAGFETIGLCPVATVENNKVTYQSTDKFNGIFMAYGLPNESVFEFSSHISSASTGFVAGMQIGFIYFLDYNNYIYLYYEWGTSTDGTYNGIVIAQAVVVANGQNAGTAQWARDPWDAYADTTFPIDNWNDFGGHVTDASYPCVVDGNFNTMRSEQTLVPTDGFDLGLIRGRKNFGGRLVDELTLRISGVGTDGKIHNWYSSALCFDAFTYPKGGEASSLINTQPIVGVYNYAAGALEYSKFKFNGVPVDVNYSDRQAVRNFVVDNLHLADYTTEQGWCKDEEHHYYLTAKTAFNALGADQKTLFMTDAEFAAANARYEAWAVANNDAAPYDNNNAIVSVLNGGIFIINNDGDSLNVVTFLIIVIVGVTSINAYLIIKKRKRN